MKKKESKFQLRPELDRAIIKPIPKNERKTPQGIIIPERSDDKKDMPRAIVMALGKDYKGSATIGDKIIYNGMAGYDVYEETNYLVIYQHDILAVYENQ
jgi:co-chaperonin GroES (HSP10)